MSIFYSKLGIPVTFYDHLGKAITEKQTIDISVMPKKRNKGRVSEYKLVTIANGAKKEMEEDDDLDLITFRIASKADPSSYSSEMIEHFYFNKAIEHAEGLIRSGSKIMKKDVNLTINGKPISEIKQYVKNLEELI